jgi:hypothetical protein
MEFKEKVISRLKEMQWSVSALSREIGIEQQEASRMFGDNARSAKTIKLAPRTLLRIARSLRVPVEYLCDDDQTEPVETERLGPNEQTILVLARHLGAAEAIRRLARIEEPPYARVPIDGPITKNLREA